MKSLDPEIDTFFVTYLRRSADTGSYGVWSALAILPLTQAHVVIERTERLDAIAALAERVRIILANTVTIITDATGL